MTRDLLTLVIWSLALALPLNAAAQTVWSGLTLTFTKTSGSDYTLPQNQDALTENVVLTRGDFGGLINYAAESSYVHFLSPVDTEWATDINNPEQAIAALNWQNLDFTSWIEAYGGQQSTGAFIPGRNAVVHLITDDVYLDLRFTSWITGGGGGYSYMRAEPPDEPQTTGDYNLDGFVDAADYVYWRKTFGNEVAEGTGADGVPDGTIDDADYGFWVEQFGTDVSPGGRGAAPVPEPTGLASFLLLLLASINGRYRT